MTDKKLIIGNSNFKSLIERNGYFVDKTLFIKELIDNEYDVVLIPRPRRFGKTLNLSMLRYFFDINEPDTAQLFEPFKIWQSGEAYVQEQGKYPVIELSLKDIKESSYENCELFLKEIIADLYQKKRYVLVGDFLNDFEKKEFAEIMRKQAHIVTYKSSLQKLSQYLFRYHHEKVIILLDEYDNPIHAGYIHGYFSEIIDFMKSFMGSAFKGNTYLYKGVITGILRISKESVFSDLNNLGVYTVLNYAFSDKFGFTEAETFSLLQTFGLGHQFEEVKQWYNGYQMGNSKNIYNPWSMVGFIAKHEEGFKPHWVNTSSDHLIREQIITKSAHEIRENIGHLLKGGTISKDINENIIFSDLETQQELLWSLLLFSGYLTIDQFVKVKKYLLKIPNYEIKTLFQDMILQWLNTGLQLQTSLLQTTIESLTNNQIEKFEHHFKQIMGDTFSYYDIHTEAERVFQSYVLGLLAILSDDYIIRSNRESGAGRYDILLLPYDKSRYGIIIEIKTLAKDATKRKISMNLNKGLKQMDRNAYFKELLDHKVERQIEMVMVFAGKEVHIKTKQ